MEFCPKCGSILIQKRKNAGCPRCGYSSKSKIKLESSEKIKESNKEVAVIKKEENPTFPIVEETCKKCGHPKSYFWTVQTRAADEAETKFFKCVKCSFTWRDYR